jgi:low affinity Fe/Cu permease
LRRSAPLGEHGFVHDAFRRFAHATSRVVGSAWSFVIALATILAWAVTGPVFGFSDTWQLIINTGTTIVTFLMVFLIQNTQNRDATAIHLKLDELIYALKGARNSMVDLEDLSDEQLERLQREFASLREHAGQTDAGTRAIESALEDRREGTKHRGRRRRSRRDGSARPA